MGSYIFSPAAKQDLHEIWHYISKENPTNALRILDEIEEKCVLLSGYPKIGHKRTDLTSYPVLFWPVHTFLIIYKEDSDPLEIVRVLSGYRNLVEVLL